MNKIEARFKHLLNNYQVGRFILGGITSLVVCLTTMWLLVNVIGLNKFVSLNLTGVVGYLYSYGINKVLVFRKNEQSHLVYGSRFIILQSLLWGLNNLLFYIGVNKFGWHYLVVNFVIAIFMSILNYTLLKFTVFK